MKLSDLQRAVFLAVTRATLKGEWYRATSSGERVTLASLWRRWGLLDRRAWRGEDGQRDTAYEYQATAQVITTIREKQR